MNLEEFTRFAQSQGFKCLPNGVFGTYRGYPLAASFKDRAGGIAVVSLSVAGKARGKLVREVKKALPRGCTFVLAAAGRYTLTCAAGGEGLDRNFISAMNTVVSAFREANLVPEEKCPVCRQECCNATALMNGAYVKVHKDCVEQMSAGTMARAEQAMQGNYVTGFIGALLGGLVGALPAVFCLVILNYYVALLYALIPLGANYGYRLFKGKLNKGAFVCTLFSSIVNLFTEAFLMGYVQLSAMLLEAGRELPTFGYAVRFMTENSDYMTEHLIMAVIFLALCIWSVWGQIRRTAVHDVRDAGAVLSSMVVNGEAPVNAAPSGDGPGGPDLA